MSADHEFGFMLSNGTRIVHSEGSIVKDAFPPEMNIPGQLQIFHPGHRKDPNTPSFNGMFGCLPFDTVTRMPRHVHMTEPAEDGARKYVVENILVMNGVGIAELGGEIYVVPPKTLVSIGRGVPHTWTACPPGLDLQELGVSPDEKVVSGGSFIAIFNYEEPTSFFPTSQTERLETEGDYVKCEDLQSIRIPEYSIEELMEKAFFVWGRSAKKLRDFGKFRVEAT